MTTLSLDQTAVSRVPFLDLKAQYESIRPEIDEAIQSVIDSGMFVLGPAVSRFEEAFAKYIGVRECVCVNSGTAALQLALMGLGLKPGEEVIIPANTFIATAEAVIWAGGKPVLVDVCEDDSNLDPAKIEAAITPKTRGIMPVHLYGQAARLDLIMEIAKRRGLFVLEDACQAHGASYRGKRAGSFGAAAAFSFYPGKNLGAYGEGGAIVTDDPKVAEMARRLRDHGQVRKYEHSVIGHNYRLEGIQGAVLGVKLPKLDGWNDGRRRAAGWYKESLAGLSLDLPQARAEAEHVHHLYVVRTRTREKFQAFLKERGIDTLIHYPIPLHFQPALAGLGHGQGAFPVTEMLAKQIVSLPIFPELTLAQVERVGDVVRAFDRAAGGD